jgi:hypothetical protein
MGGGAKGALGRQPGIRNLMGKLLENGAQVRQHRFFFDKANQPWDSSV